MSTESIKQIYHQTIQNAINTYLFAYEKSQDEGEGDEQQMPLLVPDDIPVIQEASKDGLMNWSSDVFRLRDIAVAIEKILFKVKIDRYYKSRPSSVRSMNSQHLLEEKTLMKKLLCEFEYVYGRPKSPRSVRIARKAYDRYRELKTETRRMDERQRAETQHRGSLVNHSPRRVQSSRY